MVGDSYIILLSSVGLALGRGKRHGRQCRYTARVGGEAAGQAGAQVRLLLLLLLLRLWRETGAVARRRDERVPSSLGSRGLLRSEAIIIHGEGWSSVEGVSEHGSYTPNVAEVGVWDGGIRTVDVEAV